MLPWVTRHTIRRVRVSKCQEQSCGDRCEVMRSDTLLYGSLLHDGLLGMRAAQTYCLQVIHGRKSQGRRYLQDSRNACFPIGQSSPMRSCHPGLFWAMGVGFLGPRWHSVSFLSRSGDKGLGTWVTGDFDGKMCSTPKAKAG